MLITPRKIERRGRTAVKKCFRKLLKILYYIFVLVVIPMARFLWPPDPGFLFTWTIHREWVSASLLHRATVRPRLLLIVSGGQLVSEDILFQKYFYYVLYKLTCWIDITIPYSDAFKVLFYDVCRHDATILLSYLNYNFTIESGKLCKRYWSWVSAWREDRAAALGRESAVFLCGHLRLEEQLRTLVRHETRREKKQPS